MKIGNIFENLINSTIVNEEKMNVFHLNETTVLINRDKIIVEGSDLSNTKIVDSNGQPLIVYRSQKNDRKQGVTRQSNMKGIYFSADAESTKIYGDNIKKYYLNIKNPIILKDTEWNLSLIPEYVYNMLISKGYDGAVWLRKGIMYEIVAFDESQIIPIN